MALHHCIAFMKKTGMVTKPAIKDHVAAISCGIVKGEALLDLDYAEDSTAETDANFVLTGGGGLVNPGHGGRRSVHGRSVGRIAAPGAQGHRRTHRLAEGRDRRMRLRRGDSLAVASHNPGKVREIEELLAPFGLMVRGAAELGLPEPDETEATFAGNAALKARAAAQASGLAVLADDSGLCVAALDGAPGIYAARWADRPKTLMPPWRASSAS